VQERQIGFVIGKMKGKPQHFNDQGGENWKQNAMKVVLLFIRKPELDWG